MSNAPLHPAPPRVRLTAVQRWQVGLIAFGIALLLVGGVVLLMDVKPERYLGIAVWFLGALILHDGIAAMVVFGVSIVMRRVGRRIPLPVIAIVQGSLVIGAIVTAIVVPEILKKNIGSANPTILPLDYGMHLALFYAGLAVATAVAIAGYLVVARRRRAS
ncbi:hypothetical protein BH11ACT5_BH11ACT5_10260 [soil metagenome]